MEDTSGMWAPIGTKGHRGRGGQRSKVRMELGVRGGDGVDSGRGVQAEQVTEVKGRKSYDPLRWSNSTAERALAFHMADPG